MLGSKFGRFSLGVFKGCFNLGGVFCGISKFLNMLEVIVDSCIFLLRVFVFKFFFKELCKF